jgi:hypothetical protein
MSHGGFLVVALISAIAGAPARGQSFQFRSPAVVEYRAPSDTGPIDRRQAVLAVASSNIDKIVGRSVARVTVAAKPPLPPGFKWSQTKAGMKIGAYGMGIGLLAGAGAGALKGASPGAFGGPSLVVLGGAAIGAVGGYSVGCALGVHRYSEAHGVHAPFAASMAGAVVGLAGIYALGVPVIFTVPFGAAVGHNVARSADSPPIMKP